MTDLPGPQPTVAMRVAAILREDIRRGRVPGGTPLRQNDVAERLLVSSTPVREAFQMLERDGLVVREGRRGVRVFRPSMDDLVDGYEVRLALEPLAAALSAARLDDAGRAALAETVARMRERPVPRADYIRLSGEFHTQLAEGSGNRHLARLIVAEHAATATYISFLGLDLSSAHEADHEHGDVLDAVQHRDAGAAEKAMRAHLQARVDDLQTRLGSAETGTGGRSPQG